MLFMKYLIQYWQLMIESTLQNLAFVLQELLKIHFYLMTQDLKRSNQREAIRHVFFCWKNGHTVSPVLKPYKMLKAGIM